MAQHRKFSEINDPQEQEQYLAKLIKKHHDDELREKWSTIVKKKPESTTNPKKHQFIKWVIFASVIMLLGLLAYFLISTTNQDPIQYAMTEVEQTITHPGITKGVSNDSEFRTKAIVAFNDSKFETAISNFMKIELPTDDDRFYTAMSHLYIENYPTAINGLKALSNKEILISQESRWYLSLAYILSNDTISAKSTLQAIGPADWNYQKATTLIKQLSK